MTTTITKQVGTIHLQGLRWQMEYGRARRNPFGWTVPASDKPARMHFEPSSMAEFLAGLAPTAPYGAICQYVWQLAFAERRGVMAVALRNLASVLDGHVTIEDDLSEEEVDQ